MADFSLSQALAHTSDDDEEEEHHSPPQTIITPVMLTSIGSASRSSSKSRMNNAHLSRNPPSSATDMIAPAAESSGRKPRGRPPGSKNKPKPPIYITKETEPSVKTHQLEIRSGLDIVEMIQKFSIKNQVGVNVMNGFGSVSNVMLRHPVIPGQSITLSGTFDLLSVSGVFLGSSTCNSKEKSPGGSSCLTVFLAGNAGQVFGGTVMGTVVAAGNVVLNVSTFGNYEFHRLSPDEFDESDHGFDAKPNVGPGHRTEGSATRPATGGVPTAIHGGGGGGPCANPDHISSHSPHDAVNWAPTARSPHF
ncbi:hypothetical protein Nepgr_014871 [Nepenthes gracilis]|uniref:PPC domain-containing protein n=1 Tax=Nepenthes gracilis TaxID=150966 RepID=A0AAD3SLP4_NEPGR|nr:hypothetical protein Nepgr_014871 [Nepenthes gracilis]